MYVMFIILYCATVRRRVSCSSLHTKTQLPRTSKVTTETQHYGLEVRLFRSLVLNDGPESFVFDEQQ